MSVSESWFQQNEREQYRKEAIWRANWAKYYEEATPDKKPEIKQEWEKVELEWEKLRQQRLNNFEQEVTEHKRPESKQKEQDKSKTKE